MFEGVHAEGSGALVEDFALVFEVLAELADQKDGFPEAKEFLTDEDALVEFSEFPDGGGHLFFPLLWGYLI